MARYLFSLLLPTRALQPGHLAPLIWVPAPSQPYHSAPSSLRALQLQLETERAAQAAQQEALAASLERERLKLAASVEQERLALQLQVCLDCPWGEAGNFL